MHRTPKELTAEYKANFDKVMEADEAILNAKNYEEWHTKFLNRSMIIREVYQSNEQLIKEATEIVSQDMSLEKAETICEIARDLYDNSYDDLFIMHLICEPVIEFYEKEENFDYTRLIDLYGIMAYEVFNFFGRITGQNRLVDDAIAYYRKILALKDKYTLIKEKKVRNTFSLVYCNLLSPLSEYSKEIREQAFELYDEAYELYDSAIRPMEDRSRKEFLDLIDHSMLSLESFLHEYSEEQVEKFRVFVERLAKDLDYEDIEGGIHRAKQSLRVHSGAVDIEDVIKESIDYILSLPIPDYASTNDNLLFDAVINYFNTAYHMFQNLDLSKLSEEQKQFYAQQVIDKVSNVLTHVPYRFMTNSFNEVCAAWFQCAKKYLPDAAGKRKLLFTMILCRQPATYIHSLMVRELAVEIAKEMLQEDSHAFDCAREMTDGDILEYIGDCALFHDIGKCGIADIINKQSRKLTEYEFGIIRNHPSLSGELIGEDKDFLPYRDVMLGHHKSYDGTKGYPAEFDNRASKIAPIIDLVSICDAMDAATDIFGRNYSAGKDFEALFKELVEGRETRYSGKIVDFIAAHPDLYNRLKELTEIRRGGIYYQAFSRLLDIKAD